MNDPGFRCDTGELVERVDLIDPAAVEYAPDGQPIPAPKVVRTRVPARVRGVQVVERTESGAVRTAFGTEVTIKLDALAFEAGTQMRLKWRGKTLEPLSCERLWDRGGWLVYACRDLRGVS